MLYDLMGFHTRTEVTLPPDVRGIDEELQAAVELVMEDLAPVVAPKTPRPILTLPPPVTIGSGYPKGGKTCSTSSTSPSSARGGSV